jgi:hypothetical protein
MIAALLAAAVILVPVTALRADSVVPAAPSLASPQGTPNGTMELDRNSDGVVDYRVTYDARGKVLREELDFNYDGKMDTFYQHKDGILQRVDVDSDYTGAIDIWVYLRDGTYVTRYERDTDGDGKPDSVRSFEGS